MGIERGAIERLSYLLGVVPMKGIKAVFVLELSIEGAPHDSKFHWTSFSAEVNNWRVRLKKGRRC
jgi:hypothetical protein